MEEPPIEESVQAMPLEEMPMEEAPPMAESAPPMAELEPVPAGAPQEEERGKPLDTDDLDALFDV